MAMDTPTIVRPVTIVTARAMRAWSWRDMVLVAVRLPAVCVFVFVCVFVCSNGQCGRFAHHRRVGSIRTTAPVLATNCPLIGLR